ncbi:hypothetical protein Q2T83_18200 [Fervidibacter sacchari]|uniref:Uncharacterized protein n=1 Tax=Candidatus Fervidibacter sacchari TaxID=1448929 RepID=A0ABT2EL83_9BACT|nr:hypothetical protein [Candidatus Fervidibacter sacchari]MCS3918459.1 hypothetical protein [Candidatus Fervidibacter sacchari]WKU16239.1 hypothetical protein Q2T83_18200 [Candidatus Fervidibacter sacchari]
MRRETFDRQESFLSVRWRARVGPKSHHRRARLALSRLCSERLPEGQKKVVTVKAKTNPEAQTTLILDGFAFSFSSAGDNASLPVWWAQPLNTQSSYPFKRPSPARGDATTSRSQITKNLAAFVGRNQ